ADAVHATVRLSQELQAEESARGLALTPEPDAGFVWPIYRWTRGESLAKVLDSVVDGDGELSAGDFVRWARQVIDLLGQIGDADGVPESVRRAAAEAVGRISRSVVGTGVP